MSRRTLAFPRPAFVFAFLGLASIGFLVHACTEPQTPTTAKDITGPQLAATASCDAPCVEVQVSVKGPGPAQSANDIVVTLWRAGGTGDGVAFHELTNSNGVATFDLDGELISSLDGFCAVARPLRSVDDATNLVAVSPDPGATTLDIVPNADGVQAQSAPWLASVSESPNKSAVLNKANLVTNCLNWTTAANAPFAVDQGTAVLVRMDMNAARASIEITCLFPNANSNDPCQSWTAISLDDVQFPPWGQVTLPDGVKKGFLASVGLGNSPAVNDGLAFGQTYLVEIAQGEESASKVITTPQQSGNNQSASVSRTAELATIVCVVNDGSPDFFESSGEVTTGMDIQPPVLDGYACLSPLQTVQFLPDAARVVIAFDYLDLGGDLTANFHMRARANPEFSDMLSTTITKSIKYDFSTCPGSPTVLSENTEPAISLLVVCRNDPAAANRKHVEITATVPEGRLIEWSINTGGGDKHPETAKKNASSALRPIKQPNSGDFDAFCPLTDFGFGVSSDPKIWGSQID